MVRDVLYVDDQFNERAAFYKCTLEDVIPHLTDFLLLRRFIILDIASHFGLSDCKRSIGLGLMFTQSKWSKHKFQ